MPVKSRCGEQRKERHDSVACQVQAVHAGWWTDCWKGHLEPFFLIPPPANLFCGRKNAWGGSSGCPSPLPVVCSRIRSDTRRKPSFAEGFNPHGHLDPCRVYKRYLARMRRLERAHGRFGVLANVSRAIFLQRPLERV